MTFLGTEFLTMRLPFNYRDSAIYKHIPKTERQQNFKINLYLSEAATDYAFDTFWVQPKSPSLRNDNTIYFESKLTPPATGHIPAWWNKHIHQQGPNFHLCYLSEYYFICYVLIETLVKTYQLPVEKAWSLICDDSSSLVDYSNLRKQPFQKINPFENTFLGFISDLATYTHIVKGFGESFFTVGNDFEGGKSISASQSITDPYTVLADATPIIVYRADL